uniref:Zinc finger GATA like protein 1 n=1 Tax=Neogobius melanostomus TaxID=47308 RepID=A0A8C6WMQ5_9GOBI
MNTGPTTQSSLLRQNKESPERDASQSALYHLSQEVSRLASPVRNSFMETDSVWFVSEEDTQRSLHCSTSLIPQVKNVKSPLKILNLINQQCERLLNQSDDEEQGDSALLISDFGGSNVPLTSKSPEVGGVLYVWCSFQPQPTCQDSSEEVPKFSTENGLPHATPLENDDGAQRSTWRSKRRKQPCPSRSASVQDPDFQGVTFRMDTELDDSKDQCRLLITSKYRYSHNLSRWPLQRSRINCVVGFQCFLVRGSVSSENPPETLKTSKVCASCCTSKTPMWRDAEDGTPLCNACGIRYKKYRVRCINCWHIPKKDGNSVSRCSKCGHFVRLTLAQRRPTL